MGNKLTDLQKTILTYIRENNDVSNWVPIEPEAFDGRSLHELRRECRELETQGLLKVDHPATTLCAIKPGGERVMIEEPNDWLLCAITANGIQATDDY